MPEDWRSQASFRRDWPPAAESTVNSQESGGRVKIKIKMNHF